LIIKKLHPQNKTLQLTFMILLFSMPVFHKTIVMYSIETWFLFLMSLTLWLILTSYLEKPSCKNTLILSFLASLLLLTRTSGLIILPVVILLFFALWLSKKINLSLMLKFSGLFLLITALFAGWFYLNPKRPINDDPQSMPPAQRWEFFTDIPFHLMMTYPIRREVPLKKFIPIYYSEFWGDWWNYYSQKRFGVSVKAIEADHYLTTAKRVASLALQNQINLLPTLLMVFGFSYLTFKTFKKLNLSALVFLSLTLFTWLGFFYKLTFHSTWKTDSIKASYMLYNLPIFVYMAVLFLFKVVKRYQLIFIPTIIWLTLATVVNLWWSWY